MGHSLQGIFQGNLSGVALQISMFQSPKQCGRQGHEGGAGSSPLAPHPPVISRCVLILPWTTCLALMSFTPGSENPRGKCQSPDLLDLANAEHGKMSLNEQSISSLGLNFLPGPNIFKRS